MVLRCCPVWRRSSYVLDKDSKGQPAQINPMSPNPAPARFRQIDAFKAA